MAESGLRVLIVDDDPAIAALVRQLIRGQGLPDPLVVGTGRDALAATEAVDVVLLDQQLPDTTGIELMGALRARPGRPSVILITGNGDEALAATALRLGADDYVIKDQSLPKLLPQVLERVRRTRALRTTLAAAEQDLVRAERLAAIGELTVTLHHEINNPLMAASAEVELLIERTTGADRQSLEAVRRSITRIADVVKRVRELHQARASTYVGETGMIDLTVAPVVRSISRGYALLWLADDDLARVISLLLRHAGFVVRRVSEMEELEREAGKLGVSAAFIGLPSTTTTPPLGGFRPAREKFYSLIALVDGDGTREHAAGADYIVRLPLDPGSFTEEVLRAMETGME